MATFPSLLVGLLLLSTTPTRGKKRAKAPVAEPAPAPAAPAPSAAPPEEVEAIEVVPSAPEGHEDWFGDGYPVFERVLDHYTARTSRPQTFNSDIAHRNNEGMFKSPFRDLLGFDGGGLKIGLGLRYGIIENLDVGIYRMNGTVEVYDTYEFDARYRLLTQGPKSPIDLAVRGGISWFNAPSSNASGYFIELLVDHIFAQRALVGGGLIYHTSSSGPNKGTNDTPDSGAFMLQADIRVVESLSISMELTTNLTGYHDKYPVITFGPKIVTNRHTFSFVFSNSQALTTDSIITNTYRINPTDWVFGFHITREI